MKTALKLRSSDRITMIELAAIKRDHVKMEALRQQYDKLAATVKEREEDVMDRMEAGVPVDGEAEILTRRRQNISWLTIVRREMGRAKIEEVKNDWPITLYRELRIG